MIDSETQKCSNSEGHWVVCFEKFWKEYPRKVGKFVARRSWSKMTIPEQCLACKALPVHVAEWKGRDKKYIPHASSWLNQRRWEDEMEPPKPDVKAEYPQEFSKLI